MGQPAGRYSAFYTLQIKHVIKWAVPGWRGFCLAFFAYTALPSWKDERNGVVVRKLKRERDPLFKLPCVWGYRCAVSPWYVFVIISKGGTGLTVFAGRPGWPVCSAVYCRCSRALLNTGLPGCFFLLPNDRSRCCVFV